MTLTISAIKDTKSGFLSPVSDMNEATAIRNFTFALENKDSLYYAFPSDFELWKLGEFDTITGIIVPDQHLLISGIDIVRKES